METLFGILASIFLLTCFIVKIRRRVLCWRQYQEILKDCVPTIVKVRYLHPTDSEQNITNEYLAKLYLKPTGFVLIPEMAYILSPDIFLFVHSDVHAGNFPKPINLCEINDFRITQRVIIVTSRVRHFFNTNSNFEMILEFTDDSHFTDRLLPFLEKKNA